MTQLDQRGATFVATGATALRFVLGTCPNKQRLSKEIKRNASRFALRRTGLPRMGLPS